LPVPTFSSANVAVPPTKMLDSVPAQRKCLHLYFYYINREFGPMHVRLETWLPFPIQVCINGREILDWRDAGAAWCAP
jgi:hypothetical protein